MAKNLEIIKLLGNKKQRALNMVNEIKINKTINPDFLPTDSSYSLINNAIEIYELAIIELWKFAFDKSSANHEKRIIFHTYCKDCFNLLQVLPIPKKQNLKINHVLKLLTYAYLGEKWEDMGRILITDKSIWKLDDEYSDWGMKLFSKIYLAILHLTRKENWVDLNQVSNLILELRNEQVKFEKQYLDDKPDEIKIASACELAALYHLGKTVELLGEYMLQGTPNQILNLLEINFDKAITYCQQSNQLELDLILRMLQLTFKKMIENSIWSVANRVNSRVKTFTQLITKSSKPIFELMYPQRVTILEKGLLDPANKAIVVELPTSGGKTMIAEFRILQALNQFSGQKIWIAYVVPTRSLVNQITNRLRNDLGIDPLNIRVEKMNGAIDTDLFEQYLIDTKNAFDILVLTPEKLNLLLRRGTDEFANSLILTIIDEAHNIGDRHRGLNLEMLISTIKNDCQNANLLLLTPFLPNKEELSRWIDPDNPKSIGIEYDWKPNDSSVGLCYVTGSKRHVVTHYKPLTYSSTIGNNHKNITLSDMSDYKFTFSKVKKNKSLITVLAAQKLIKRGNVLILGGRIVDTWTIAKNLSNSLPNISPVNEKITLVQKFISAELGKKFPLIEYLNHGVGVHNAGLPDDVKQLMEWLMENNLLKALVATTTIAQGMNFPASSILLSTYYYHDRYKSREMQAQDFENLSGRVGRINQQNMGIVGISVDGLETKQGLDATKFVQKTVDHIISVLVHLVKESLETSKTLNLKTFYHQPEWSVFLGYLAHMYNQSEDLNNFIINAEIKLRNTCGYLQLDSTQKKILLNAVTNYASELDANKENSLFSDMTGFSPETIKATVDKVQSLGIKQTDWNSSSLFTNSSKTLTKLMGVMLENIPEIKDDLSNIKVDGTLITNSSLSNIVSDWVSGNGLPEISEKYFGGSDVDSMKNCVSAIYGKISNFATWGFSAIQKLSLDLIDDSMTDHEKNKLQNLSAMIYYGVNSDEAILMRMNGVPRSIADNIGKLYLDEYGSGTLYKSNSVGVIKWLNDMDVSKWNSSILPGKGISGSEYKQIWKQISGI